MARFIQPEGRRGSLKWIQQAITEEWSDLVEPLRPVLGTVAWRSPLKADDFAEYRDGAFLDRIGLSRLRPQLAAFWPRGGPQWDALGITAAGGVVLVEAKAHVGEMCSPATTASAASRAVIADRLDACATALGAGTHRASWADHFYQLGNRLAHLAFLRDHGVAAYLVLVNFIGDRDIGGPATAEAWRAAYQVAFHVMGLTPTRLRHVVEVFPDVSRRA